MTEKLIRSFSSVIRNTVPKTDGFHMPGEWHRHARTLMLWPDRPENWKEESKPARAAFANVIKAIAEFENVMVGVSSNGWDSAFGLIGSHPNVTMKSMEYDDVWMRDTGPTFLINEKEQLIGGIAWDFNCWGEIGGTLEGILYNVPYEKDKLVSRTVLESTRATPLDNTPENIPQDAPQIAPHIFAPQGLFLKEVQSTWTVKEQF